MSLRAKKGHGKVHGEGRGVLTRRRDQGEAGRVQFMGRKVKKGTSNEKGTKDQGGKKGWGGGAARVKKGGWTCEWGCQKAKGLGLL